jgi:hypothetical protein
VILILVESADQNLLQSNRASFHNLLFEPLKRVQKPRREAGPARHGTKTYFVHHADFMTIC